MKFHQQGGGGVGVEDPPDKFLSNDGIRQVFLKSTPLKHVNTSYLPRTSTPPDHAWCTQEFYLNAKFGLRKVKGPPSRSCISEKKL